MYQQQNFQQPSFVQSQYRGGQQQQTRYQPTGNVQSFYQGGMTSTAPTTSIGSTYSSMGFQNQGYGQGGYVSTDAFHTTNYHGNQPGHDNYLRADSVNPSSFSSGYPSSMGTGYQGGFQNTFQSGIGSSTPYSNYGMGTSSFHAANYRGNQPGHDNYLRADSTSPVSGVANQYQAQNQQAFHTSSYVGNQPGHDQYLRADSTQPSSGFGYGSFR